MATRNCETIRHGAHREVQWHVARTGPSSPVISTDSTLASQRCVPDEANVFLERRLGNRVGDVEQLQQSNHRRCASVSFAHNSKTRLI